MGQQRVFLTVQSIQIRKISRSRLKAKERTKLNFGQTITELVCPKNKEVRQFFERLYNSHRKGVFSLVHNKQKGSSSDYDSHKGKGKDQERKGGFSAYENSVEEGQVHSSESFDWYSDYSDDSQFSVQRHHCVQFKTLCVVSISSSGTCPPSDARCCGSLLHTINWIKNGNQKVPDIWVASWYNDIILSLQ